MDISKSCEFVLMTSILTSNLCLTKINGSMDLAMDSGTGANMQISSGGMNWILSKTFGLIFQIL